MRSTTLNLARNKAEPDKSIPGKVGKFSRRVDIVLLSKYTRLFYNALSWKEARVLVQFRTGMVRLNSYFSWIKAVPID
jgi:hypothetical protein